MSTKNWDTECSVYESVQSKHTWGTRLGWSVTLVKLLGLSVPRFPYLSNGNNSNSHIVGL